MRYRWFLRNKILTTKRNCVCSSKSIITFSIKFSFLNLPFVRGNDLELEMQMAIGRALISDIEMFPDSPTFGQANLLSVNYHMKCSSIFRCVTT